MEVPSTNEPDMTAEAADHNTVKKHETLKYSLLGPSLTKSGQDNVDQQKVHIQVMGEGHMLIRTGIGSHLQRVEREQILQQ
jgi:hypothetical protein